MQYQIYEILFDHHNHSNKFHKAYLDNISDHHHFYDEKTNELFDIPNNDVILKKLPHPPDGHEIKAVDVVIHIQRK